MPAKPAINVTTVLNQMRKKGLMFHCEHNNRRHRIVWSLSDGTEVPDTITSALIHHPNIRPTGDVLPLGKGPPCQTYILCL